MDVDAAGDIVACGDLHGTTDFGGGPLVSAGSSDALVVKLTGSGAHVFSRRAGNTGVDNAFSTAVDATGHVYAIGRFYGTVDFGVGPLTAGGSGGDAFLIKLEP